MLHLKTINKIIQTQVSPYMELVKGEGYFYFVYDNGPKFETKSVCTFRLNNLTLDMWIDDARDFHAEMMK